MLIRLLVTLLIYSIVGWIFCDIDPHKCYSWYHGIWHGLFFLINLMRSWVWDALYKAEVYTTAYNFFYWIFAGFSSLCFLIGGSFGGRR